MKNIVLLAMVCMLTGCAATGPVNDLKKDQIMNQKNFGIIRDAHNNTVKIIQNLDERIKALETAHGTVPVDLNASAEKKTTVKAAKQEKPLMEKTDADSEKKIN